MSLSEEQELALADHRSARSSCWMRSEKNKPDRRTALEHGLAWLHTTEQPDDALCHPNGVPIHMRGARYATFIPDTEGGLAAVSVSVSRPLHSVDTGENVNVLADGESDEIAADLAALGADVAGRWNGDGTGAVTFTLRRPIAASLQAAVSRYRVGCTEHLSRGSLCECRWYERGDARLVLPDVPYPGAVV